MQTAIAPTPKNGSVHTKPIRIPTKETPLSVLTTTDYDQFILMDDNRNVNELHVQRLVSSFKDKHLICPIIVNEKMEVIDGQHRLQASIRSELPVHYIVVKGYGLNEVQVLNSNQKNWTKYDFLESYCAQNKKHYLDFKEFMGYFPDFGIQVSERILTEKYSNGRRQERVGGKTNLPLGNL
jgi:hypothetical protein